MAWNCAGDLLAKAAQWPGGLNQHVLAWPVLHLVPMTLKSAPSCWLLCMSAMPTSSFLNFVLFLETISLWTQPLSLPSLPFLVHTSEQQFSSVFLQSLEDAQNKNISTLDHSVPGVRPAQCESSCQHNSLRFPAGKLCKVMEQVTASKNAGGASGNRYLYSWIMQQQL